MRSDSQDVFPLQAVPPEPPREPRPQRMLIDLTPNTYVDTEVRVISVRGKEQTDELGIRPYSSGVVEDATFRATFVSYKPDNIFFRDTVLHFHNAYVHEFPDHSVLLVLGEHSRIHLLPNEDIEDYVWQPTIEGIRRPLGRSWVTLTGVVSTIYPSSGLVKRCEECHRVLYSNVCPEGHTVGWRWAVRTSAMLSDATGSINTIFNEYLTCQLLERPISEILYFATVADVADDRDLGVESFLLEPPETLPICEATVVEPNQFRDCTKPVVSDLRSCKIYYPRNVSVASNHIVDVQQRTLEYANDVDRALYTKLLAKTIDRQIRHHTQLPKLHGVYLVEDPITLYWTEKAKLYLGHEVNVTEDLDGLKAEFIPSGLIRESVFDYVQWRRSRGASAKSIVNTILKWRRNVVLAPNGTYGRIVNVLYKTAEEFEVPTFNGSLPAFWCVTHDLPVQPFETPLLVVKPYNIDVELTYPPSCVFFDDRSLYVRSSVWAFVNYKHTMLRHNTFHTARTVLKDLTIGGHPVPFRVALTNRLNVQRMVLHDIKRMLLGTPVTAKGPVQQLSDRLYLFPRTVSVTGPA